MHTLDIPQANNLTTIRAVVFAVAHDAVTKAAVRDLTKVSGRHSRYRIAAAKVLGFIRVEGEALSLTSLGARLLATELESVGEREVYADAIDRSKIMQALAPTLLSPRGPSLEALTARLEDLSTLSYATARRRAAGLLRWRQRVLDLALIPIMVSQKNKTLEAKPQPEPEAQPRQLSLF